MTWCLRNEVLVTGCGRGFGLGGGGVSRVLPEAGRIPRGHWRAGQGELGPDSNVSSQASPMVSHPPQSLCQNLDVLFSR